VTTTWFVPGRLEVFGKHTDYAGGRSLVCAVPRGITVHGHSVAEPAIDVEDTATGERATFTSAGEGPGDGWRRYPRTVIRRLAENFPGARLSARLRLSSDLPQAAGISSSSALVVGMAESLIAAAGLEEHPAWREAIRTPEDRAAYFGCIENGATFRTLAGDDGVGTHGGSEDHAAILLSRVGELRQFSFDPLALDRVVPMPAGWTFLVVSSGVEARKTNTVQAHYNRLSTDAAALVDAWREAHPGDLRSLGRLVHDGALREWMAPAALQTRLDHFVAEDRRVADASAAFTGADIRAIGELAQASFRDADQLLGNQTVETRALVQLARTIGAPAASPFGAGWGGSVWALVASADADRLLAAWLAAYRARFPQHHSIGFVSPPSGGAVCRSDSAGDRRTPHPGPRTPHPGSRTPHPGPRMTHPGPRTPHSDTQ
jgi:galactokinase